MTYPSANPATVIKRRFTFLMQYSFRLRTTDVDGQVLEFGALEQERREAAIGHARQLLVPVRFGVEVT
jgi:hypothetical protein